jgi:ferric-dicitrate binding protein FerR (iron transport regulator)
MNERNLRIDKTIRDYLDGTLTEAGRDLLLEWTRRSGENTAYFRKYCREWDPTSDPSVERSWLQFRIKRQLRENAGKFNLDRKIAWSARKMNITRIQFVRFAAVLVIGLTLAFFLSGRIGGYLHEKNGIQWVRAETLAGQKTKVVLPDSSVVWLNSETTLSFPSDFSPRRNRIIQLDGEAFFEVAHHNCNFTVRCKDYDIIVKGTKFNVMAYKDFDRTETTLVEGSVEIRRENQTIGLMPGERAVYSRNYLTRSKAQVRQATLWKDNRFYFDNVPFRELARRLERWYDVTITLNDPSLNDILYSGYFKNEETVWQVLDVIQMTTPIVYERKEFREIVIDRKSNQDFTTDNSKI